MEFLSSLVIIFIILNLPLIPIILFKGIRIDRLTFTIYLFLFFTCAYFLSISKSNNHLLIFFSLCNAGLLFVNLFFMSRYYIEGLFKPKAFIFLNLFLLTFPVALTLFFPLVYRVERVDDQVFFSSTPFPSFILISYVFSLVMLTLGWERIERGTKLQISERLFLLGIPFWWLILSFILFRMIFAGDMVSINLLRILFLAHLIWLLYVYRLVQKGRFLKVNLHPSPKLLLRTTHSLVVLGIFAIFFWLKALEKKWSLPSYSVEVIIVIILFSVLWIPIFPFGPLRSFRRTIQNHLYLPEQDFAIEVSLYLKVMGGKERLEIILSHLQERLSLQAVALYRPQKIGGLKLHLSFPLSISLPEGLGEINEIKYNHPEGLEILELIPLKGNEFCPGYLVLFGEGRRFSWEEESLLRFWSETLGLLVKELEWKEKEREREKIALFCQATSFLIHDAKNLAQLLDLILKNYHRLQGVQKQEFIEEALPGLEQARRRAKKILEKLETFHPADVLVPEKIDLIPFLNGIINEIGISLKRHDIIFLYELTKAPWKGDPNALRKAIENLLINAFQATKEGEKIEVHLKVRDGGYIIQVIDQGIGVLEEDRDRLFEPLFTRKESGSGLGLYQAKLLIQAMGGEIGYMPNVPKGSIFYVWLDSNIDSRG